MQAAENELEYVHRLWERLQDACEVTREHLQQNVVWQKRYYDVRANESHTNLVIWLGHEQSQEEGEVS